MKISEIDFGKSNSRIQNILREEFKCVYLQDALRLSDAELLRASNFGRTSLKSFKEKVRELSMDEMRVSLLADGAWEYGWFHVHKWGYFPNPYISQTPFSTTELYSYGVGHKNNA